MIDEAYLMKWFSEHPFTRTVTVLAIGAVTQKIKQDWNDYNEAKKLDPTITYSYWVMSQKAIWGVVTALVISVAPAIYGEIMKILGGSIPAGL